MKKIDQEVITAQHVNLEELEGKVQLDKVKKKKISKALKNVKIKVNHLSKF